MLQGVHVKTTKRLISRVLRSIRYEGRARKDGEKTWEKEAVDKRLIKY